ncbi:MAG: hypothetical protein PHD82_04615 [Candidatus Riflebacteria bacterium]|jgi:hypothetical protein|nr:hypothetical protein [Candidatus Riflebacteria bacterium]
MNKRRGFSIFFIFLVIMLILFASFFSQTVEMYSIGRRQTFYLQKNAVIQPIPVLPEVPAPWQAAPEDR